MAQGYNKSNLESIQNLLSICFFLAAYLYDIKKQEVHDDFIILLAKIGGGKGVVSRHYIFEGIQQIMTNEPIYFGPSLPMSTPRNYMGIGASWATVCRTRTASLLTNTGNGIKMHQPLRKSV